MLTRMHFDTVANSLRLRLDALIDNLNRSPQIHIEAVKVWHAIACDMRTMFADSNPRFDEEKFNDASGITSVEYFLPSVKTD